MRILLTGATGLIGSAILSQLVRDGHDVVAIARQRRERWVTGPGTVRWVALDMTTMTPEQWAPHPAQVR